MAIDQRTGSKVSKHIRREDAPGTRVDPYPYIGVVKNNLDPTRSGRLQVFIPDLGGNPDDQKNWRTVSYASPFMGYTSTEQKAADPYQTENKFDTVTHTYGMWAVPPDLGVEVIVLFVAGDPLRGYWLACVNSNLSHHMLPGMAGSTNFEVATAEAGDKKTLIYGIPVPVVEFNENNKDSVSSPQFYNLPKPVHTVQYNILKNQGLDRDPIRGSTTSSSQRETPSHVFGISTPGRPMNDPADDGQYEAKLNSGEIDKEYFRVKSRKGGHTFVMDDGATLGEDQLVRLRTAKGHQVLMHDTANNLYISHADGTSWIELTPQGAVKIYAKSGFHVRSEGSINLHSDSSINIEAKNNINFRAGNKFQVNSVTTNLLQNKFSLESASNSEFKVGGTCNFDVEAKISLKAGGAIAIEGSQLLQQSGGTNIVNKLTPLPTNDLPDVTFDSSLGVWLNKAKALNTIVTAAPTHEPYYRGASVEYFKSEAAGVTPQEKFDGASDATKTVTGAGLHKPAGDKSLRNQPDPGSTVGNLSKEQMTALLAQIGNSESGGNYTSINPFGYIGKYQFGAEALQRMGYIKSGLVTSYKQLGAEKHKALLNNPNSWVANKCASQDEFLNNPALQEKIMEQFTAQNYSDMISNGAITKDMTPEDVGGMLMTGHMLGASGANTWRKTGSGQDGHGPTGSLYFKTGIYAVSVLAPKMPEINAG
jgi:hypothetical protein